jgi:Asp-tRNA(Asn)/Glu-tRNA(Gln) amidotransferase A subunit family amidase
MIHSVDDVSSDLALAYAVMAGPADVSPSSLYQPEPHLAGFEQTGDLSDITIGVFWDWFNDSREDVRAACMKQIEALVARGAKV